MNSRKKRAFLVLGPEGSGTKLLTRIFIDAGCAGDYSHKQSIDAAAVPTGNLLVLRRSFPHAEKWPNLKGLVAWLNGYEVRAVVIIRTYRCTFASRARRRENKVKAEELALAALPRLFQSIEKAHLPFVWVTYEALIQRPEVEVDWLMKWAGLETPAVEYIFDGNERYG